MKTCDILVVGGGAAGVAAATSAANAGAEVLLVEAKSYLGGVLRQCKHYGFGRGQNGIEYADALCAMLPETVEVLLETTVVEILSSREALFYGSVIGHCSTRFSELVLATGCYEIPAGALDIAGTRPRGIYTAGTMQEMMNLHGFIPEGPVVILGSGDLGLIMAAHLASHGISVTLVEQRGSCGGLMRNQSCLAQSNVSLICNTTITKVFGYPVLEGVVLENGSTLFCHTLLIAVGLRPDLALVCDLGEPDWLHLCGNCRKVQAMIEAVVEDGKATGHAAAYKYGRISQ